MTSFSLHLILCNLFIAFSILAVTAIKHLFKNHLSARAIYRLWSVLFVLMALPFIPVRLPEMLTTAAPAPNTHASGNCCSNIQKPAGHHGYLQGLDE